ncbi:hypothetical protein AAFN60_12205 [Roseibacillus persicicus]|uniref:hypothetical protein n=1 Tax=Roseibacillus persicicus TaxID=454148 RepID=UPI00398A53D2
MMKRPFLCVSLLAFATSASIFAEEVEFMLKFEPGKSYITESQIEQASSMQMAGQNIDSKVSMKMVTSQVVSKSEEGLDIVQEIDSLKMDMLAAGMELKFDSENPGGGMLDAMISPMMKSKSTLTLDGDGKVVEVVAEVAPGMENMGMGEAEVTQSAREVFDLMPNKVISEGDSWKSTSNFPTGGMTEAPVPINYVLTFDSMVEKDGHKMAKVIIKGTIDDGDENLQVTSRELGGEMLFDPAIGQPREVMMNFDVEIGLPEGVEVAEGAAGKMPLVMKTVSKLKEIK